DTRYLPKPRFPRGRRSVELWSLAFGCVASRRRLHRPNSQGRETGRPAGAVGHETRISYQPQYCQRARARRAASAARPCRRGARMRRRDFIALLGSTAVAWPLTVRGQQPAIPAVGYLSSGTSAGFAHFVDAFREGLSETGYVEGRNVTFQFRWAEGHEDRLPALAGGLVARQVAVIAVTGGLHPAVVAKAATSIIPIVFTGGGDPEKLGLVASLARPGANATGAINFSPVVTAKRLELFRQLLPTGSTIAVLSNPTDPNN